VEPIVRPRRRRVAPAPLLFLLALIGTLGAGLLVGPHAWPLPPSFAAGGEPSAPIPSPTPTPARPSDRPLPGVGAAEAPLGSPLPAPAGGGAHSFAALQEDGVTPVAYDPCRPVHVVVRSAQAPAGGAEVVAEALARLSEATGLRFVDDGPTDEVPSAERPSYQPDRYGDRWAPVLVSWDTVAENPFLDGEVIGSGGSAWRSLGEGPRVYVSGTVSLDAVQITELLERSDGAAHAEAVVLHELAHVVGLGHVDDPAELMYPRAQRGVTAFGPGDLTGLARLGSGPCVPEL
jgi:Matrixin